MYKIAIIVVVLVVAVLVAIAFWPHDSIYVMPPTGEGGNYSSVPPRNTQGPVDSVAEADTTPTRNNAPVPEFNEPVSGSDDPHDTEPTKTGNPEVTQSPRGPNPIEFFQPDHPLNRPYLPWPDSNSPDIEPLFLGGIGGGAYFEHANRDPQEDKGVMPFFVDPESLTGRVTKKDGSHWNLKNRVHDFAENPDGAALLSVSTLHDPSSRLADISEVQVWLVGSDKMWGYKWHEPSGSKKLYVPFTPGDLLLVRATLTNGSKPEAYVTDKGMGGNDLNDDYRKSGEFLVQFMNTVTYTSANVIEHSGDDGTRNPIENAVVMNPRGLVLGRSDTNGNLTISRVANGDGKGINPKLKQVIAHAPGCIPRRFESASDIGATITLKRSAFVVRGDLPDLARYPDFCRLHPADSFRDPQLFPLLPSADLESKADVTRLMRPFAILNQRGRQELPEWRKWLGPVGEGRQRYPTGAMTDDTCNFLSRWYINRFQIGKGLNVAVEIPAAGKYLLTIGSSREGYGTQPLGSFTHFVYIDATNPAEPEFRLFERPE